VRIWAPYIHKGIPANEGGHQWGGEGLADQGRRASAGGFRCDGTKEDKDAAEGSEELVTFGLVSTLIGRKAWDKVRAMESLPIVH